MRILAIETSCDETAIAIVDFDGGTKNPKIKVLSNIVSSQIKLHAKFGGVVPNLAKREHQKNLVPILLRALKETGPKNPKFEARNPKQYLNYKTKKLEKILEREQDLFARIVGYALSPNPPKIDAVAVTYGPGLEPALWVGINFAKALSYIWSKPIIPVDHMAGHLYSSLIVNKKIDKPSFPALALLVSGGHTELVLMRGWNKFKIVGETLDDAAGEAFDKVARLLGLEYPGGPEISRLAQLSKSDSHSKSVVLPRPMLNSPDFNFSFSGLKTAVLYLVRDLGPEQTKKLRPLIANEFQNAVVDVLISKTTRAAKKYKVKTILLGGGVAANDLLRKRLSESCQKLDIGCLIVDKKLSGDNALMIATAAYFSKKPRDGLGARKTARKKLRAVGNLRLATP